MATRPKTRRNRQAGQRAAGKSPYNDHRWRELSKDFRTINPVCVECDKRGETPRRRAKLVVDHIIPHRGDMSLFWNVDNLQTLCSDCHNAKTKRGE